MLTLAIDAALSVGTVAILRDRVIIAESSVPMRGAHEERLMPAVAAALGHVQVQPSALDRIVCGSGPGSFTSLRIGAAIAKGLAVGVGRPLYAVSSLVLMVAAQRRDAGEYFAALGALRGESFVQPVRVLADGLVVVRGPVEIVPDDALADRAGAIGARTIGPGMQIDATPHARGVALASAGAMEHPVDLVSWEPTYGRVAEAQARWEAAHGRPLPHA